MHTYIYTHTHTYIYKGGLILVSAPVSEPILVVSVNYLIGYLRSTVFLNYSACVMVSAVINS